MKNFIFSTGLVGIALVMMTACGGGSNTPKETSDSNTTTGAFTGGPISISDLQESNGSLDEINDSINKNTYKIVSGDYNTSHTNITPQNFRNIVIDNNGNKYAVGSTELYNGDITDGNNGEIDGLLVKFDSDNKIVWDRTIGGSDNDVFRDIAIDEYGDIFVVGHTHSIDMDISDGNYDKDDYARSSDALLVKFDNNGNKLWDRTVGGSDYDGFNCIVLDSDGNLYAAGHTESRDNDIAEYRDSALLAALLVKFDKTGKIIWSSHIPTAPGSSVREMGFTDIIIDIDNNLYLTEADSKVYKYDSIGSILWERSLSNIHKYAFSGLLSIVLDNNNNIIASGNIVLNDLNGVSWVVKLSPEGNIIWNQDNLIGQQLFDIKINSYGEIYAVDEDGSLLKLDSEGNKITNTPLPSPYRAELYGLSINDEDKIYAVGMGRDLEKSGAFLVDYSD